MTEILEYVLYITIIINVFSPLSIFIISLYKEKLKTIIVIMRLAGKVLKMYNECIWRGQKIWL